MASVRLRTPGAAPSLLEIPPDRGLRQGENGVRSPSEEQSLANPVRVSLGIQNGVLVLSIGDHDSLMLDADTADQLSADLRTFALELRRGGQLT